MARKRHTGTRLRMRVEGRVAQAKRRAAANATPVPSGGRVARFLRFMGSSLACTVIDQVLAGVLFLLLRKPMRGMGFLRILVGTVIARVVSQTVNYSLNHRLVFAGGSAQAQRPSRRESLPRFLAVAAFVLSLSTLGVYLLHTRFGIVEPVAKVGVDATLFFLNYYLQRNWVFTTEPTISPRKALKRPRS
jgi:dolichol-phosphate mannosyltransferase